VRYQAALRPDELTLGFPSKQSQDVLQPISHLQENLVALGPFGYAGLRKVFSRTSDGIAAVVKEFFDSEDILHVFLFIDAMSGVGFPGSKIRKFGFPKPQDVRFDTDYFANLADPEKELIGNLGCAHGLQSFLNVAEL
jgi:hypothetical protein